MKRSITLRIFIICFIFLCAVPGALAPFVQSGATKEELSSFPDFIEDGKYNFDFFREFDTWFSEHFAFRAQLVTVRSLMIGKLLKTSADADVILGSNDMLYYTPTADDYLDTDLLSDAAIADLGHTLRLIKAHCEANGAAFVFTMAPDKPSVYPEYMPKNFRISGDEGNAERLAKELAADNIYCNLIEELNKVKGNVSEPIWHTTDSHWNNISALAARNAIVKMLPDTGRRDIFKDVKWEKRLDWQGDLAEMLYPSAVPMDNQYYTDYDFTYRTMGLFNGLDDPLIDTECDGVSGSLLMFRDSFGETLLPFMAETFGKAEFSRLVPYDLFDLSRFDAVVMEMGERNLPIFYTMSPRIPAPAAQAPADAKALSADEFTVYTEQAGNYTHVCGNLTEDCEYPEGVPAVFYVTVGGVTYEAFTSCETSLTGINYSDGVPCYSVYVQGEVDPADMTLAVSFGEK